jgi:oxygen-independent coproporphyrinogen-3 oxidase
VLRQIVASLRRYLPIDPDCEITLEVNPEDVTAASLDAWAAVGIDNLSLGIQSFDAAGLELLGRSHTRELAVAALEAALTGSFSTVSLDLIFALPDQSPGRWQADLETALGFGPDHISCYELTIHEGTRFDRMREKGDMLELGEDDRAELFLLTHRVLAENGYRAYEVSSFARDTAHRSSHNQKYWDHSAYLGLGPSAHSFNGIATRWWNERRLVSWEAASAPPRLPVAGREDLSPAELVLESLALGLRTTAGVNLGDLGSRHGIDLLEANRELIVRLERDGFVELEPSGHALAPTLRGLAVADALARSFEIPS